MKNKSNGEKTEEELFLEDIAIKIVRYYGNPDDTCESCITLVCGILKRCSKNEDHFKDCVNDFIERTDYMLKEKKALEQCLDYLKKHL